MQKEQIEPVDLNEFTAETVAAMGEGALQAAHPWVAYALGFAYQNQSSTADLEGVMDVQDRLKHGDTGVALKDNNSLYLNFMRNGSQRLPATAAMLASYHLPTMSKLLPECWLHSLSRGFMKTGVTEGYQVEAIISLFSSLRTHLKVNPEGRLFAFDGTNNRNNHMILLVLAHSALKRGVVPRDQTQEEALDLLSDMFIKLNQPGGFYTLSRMSDQFLMHETDSDGLKKEALSEAERERRLKDVVNPLFLLYANSAHKIQLFDTQARHIFEELTKVLRKADGRSDVYLHNAEYARQLALRTLMANPDVWREQLKRPSRGLSSDANVAQIEVRLRNFLMELDSLRFESEAPLKEKVFTRLYDALIPWASKVKCEDKYKLRLVDLLVPYLDLATCYKESRGNCKTLLKTYITEHRRDMISLISRKDRGKLIEDELGL